MLRYTLYDLWCLFYQIEVSFLRSNLNKRKVMLDVNKWKKHLKYKPEWLKENPYISADDAPLTRQQADDFIKLTISIIGLTLPSIPAQDKGVKMSSDADVRTTCFDALLLAVPNLTLDISVQVLVTKGCHVGPLDSNQ